MALTYTWSFPQFDVAKSEDGLTDVVKTIHWRYDAVDDIYTAGAYGTVALDPADQGAFIPFTQLTAQWAIDRVSAQLKLDEVNAALEAHIEKLKNPPVVAMVPPFAAL